MKKIIIITSVIIASLFILTSFSSVADAKVMENRLLQERSEKISGFRQLKVMLDKTEDTLIDRIASIIGDYNLNSFTSTSNTDIRMGLISTLIVTILAEFYAYVNFFSDNMNLRTIGTLFFISMVINVITNPAINIAYILGYHDVDSLEYIVFVVEIYMIFALFNMASLDIDIDDASDLSLYANTFSFEFCKYINSLI